MSHWRALATSSLWCSSCTHTVGEGADVSSAVLRLNRHHSMSGIWSFWYQNNVKMRCSNCYIGRQWFRCDQNHLRPLCIAPSTTGKQWDSLPAAVRHKIQAEVEPLHAALTRRWTLAFSFECQRAHMEIDRRTTRREI